MGPPSPLVLNSSHTMLPEKMSSESSQLMATGCSVQVRRLVEVAWPQDMFPQTFPNGLFW
ncbi:hypothetical protein QF050_003043 [Arthrobacter sp. SLBN-112]|nr:hypothetical protein [Arthrobacter sp. SLBN-112]